MDFSAFSMSYSQVSVKFTFSSLNLNSNSYLKSKTQTHRCEVICKSSIHSSIELPYLCLYHNKLFSLSTLKVALALPLALALAGASFYAAAAAPFPFIVHFTLSFSGGGHSTGQ